MTQEQIDEVRRHFNQGASRRQRAAARAKCEACQRNSRENNERFCNSCLQRFDRADFNSERVNYIPWYPELPRSLKEVVE